MSDFIPGLELKRIFYTEAVKPILDREFPALQYSAALIGSGSEVLSFDTEMSRDHHWGPRVMLFFPDEDEYPREAIHEMLRQNLPYLVRGYSTHFERNYSEGDRGTQLPKSLEQGPVNHLVEMFGMRDIMNLCFLMEKTYAPYAKWFGTAFAKLDCADELTPILRNVQRGETWQVREQHLCAAYKYVAQMHNALGITEKIPAKVSSFHGRPFKVIHSWRFEEAIREEIRDPVIKEISGKRCIGSIDQYSDIVDMRRSATLRIEFRGLYGGKLARQASFSV